MGIFGDWSSLDLDIVTAIKNYMDHEGADTLYPLQRLLFENFEPYTGLIMMNKRYIGISKMDSKKRNLVLTGYQQINGRRQMLALVRSSGQRFYKGVWRIAPHRQEFKVLTSGRVHDYMMKYICPDSLWDLAWETFEKDEKLQKLL